MPLNGILHPDLVFLIGVTLFTLLVALSAAGGTIYVLKYSPRARLRRRLAAVTDKESGGIVERSEKGGGSGKRKLIQAKLKEIEDSKKKSRRRNQVRQLLLEAGIEIPVRKFYVISAIAALVGAGAYLATGFMPAGAVLVAVPSGWLFPKWILSYLAGRRKRKFTSQFADAIDVIVRGIQSGLPVSECLTIVAREAPEPVGLEFRLVTESTRLGLTLDAALVRALERMPTPELKFFAIVIGIQQQTGGNLAETLGNLSRVLRERKKMADKVRAMSSEARTTAMIIGSLPFIMCGLLFLTSPEYIINLFTDIIGHILIGAGLTLMLIGSFVMKKMISFEI